MPLMFLKLGGSLITQKAVHERARRDVIRRIALEIAHALMQRKDLLLVIGHGSGSFGHTAAHKYQTQLGVRSSRDWVGFAEVAAAAARLNAVVMTELIAAGLPVLRLQPSASALCRDGMLVHLEVAPIRSALAQKLIPVIYGDVAFDDRLGGTIVSTEALFEFVATSLLPARILLVGDYEGVLDQAGNLVELITSESLARIAEALTGSHNTDVTGGMNTKVRTMLALCDSVPKLAIDIFSGSEEGQIERALVDDNARFGTRLRAF